MSKEHRLEDVDLEGDAYAAVALPKGLSNGAVVEVHADAGASLNAPRAVRLALFLLKAAGVELVGAARKVVDTREAERHELLNEDGTGNEEAWHRAQDARDDAIDELAAVLKSIDGETT